MHNRYPNTTTTNYPFGMLIKERAYTSNSYRFGFNGKEKDDEIKSENNALDFGARIYDIRLGKWMSMDPVSKEYPDMSPYAFVHNTPIMAIDNDGKRTYFIGGAAFTPKPIQSTKRFAGHLIRDLSSILGDDFHVVKSSAYNKPLAVVTGARWSVMNGSTVLKVADNEVLKATRDEILADFNAAKEKGGNEPLNIIASSYGTVVAAQVAIDLLESGAVDKIDNLILRNSMINQSVENPLYAKLVQLKNDGKLNFEFKDEPGDNTTNSSGNNSKEGRKNFRRILPSFLNRKHPHNIGMLDKGGEKSSALIKELFIDKDIENENNGKQKATEYYSQ